MQKKDYFENQFIKYKNNVKMTWQTINQVLNRNKSKGRLPDTFREKNKDVSFSDPVVIANRFNEYFVSVGPNLAKKFQKMILQHSKNISKAIIEKACLLNQLLNMK